MPFPFMGEIRLFAGDYAPSGWMRCDGQSLAIRDNEALYHLIGNTYGGDGETTFNLPDLRGRVPVHLGSAESGKPYVLGESGGSETAVLETRHLPTHQHTAYASQGPAEQRNPAEGVFARASSEAYASEFTGQALAPAAVTTSGDGRPHANVQPSLCLNYIISIAGIVPDAC